MPFIDHFMREHAGAKALIIDARGNGGGGIAEMDVMLPYLYAAPTRLVSMDVAKAIVDRNGLPFQADSLRNAPAPVGIVRRDHWVTPHSTEKRLIDAKIYYLTSGHTASAAEHLALAFKRMQRATLVGETTAGGNHFGGFESIGNGLALFLPVGRTIDPDTGRDWEGVGIEPGVRVPADQALDRALVLASR